MILWSSYALVFKGPGRYGSWINEDGKAELVLQIRGLTRPENCHQVTPESCKAPQLPSCCSAFQAGTSPGAGSDAQSFSNIHMPLSTALHNFIQAFKNHSIKISALPFYPVLHPAQVTRYSLKGRQCHIAIVTRVNEDMTFKLLADLVICFLKSKHLHLDGD